MNRLITSAAAAALVACASHAGAGVITLDMPDAQIASTSGNVLDARYRISNNNWDQLIAKDSNITPDTIVATRNLGNHNALNGALWNFTISYDTVAGWSFNMTHVSGGSPGVTDSTLTWSVPHGPDNTSPFRSYNGLELFAVIGSLPSGITAASMEATGLAFSSAGNTIVGSLGDVSSTGGLVRKWIYADFDLASTNWSLTGQLKGAFVGSTGSNLDERIKFDVKATTITVVPTPAAAAILGLAGLATARRRR